MEILLKMKKQAMKKQILEILFLKENKKIVVKNKKTLYNKGNLTFAWRVIFNKNLRISSGPEGSSDK